MDDLKVLALNAGSSSLKASLFGIDRPGEEGSAPTGLLWNSDSDQELNSLRSVLAPLWSESPAPIAGPEEIDVVGHRVVHGGATLLESMRLTPEVRTDIARVAEYAPAHNAAALSIIEDATRLFGADIPQVAVFDSAFHRTMSAAAFTYAGPYSWVQSGIRRHGFHGISHQYTSHRAARLLNRPQRGFRVVTCHLGSGCSLAAVKDGASVDTTMGFTPVDGLPMAKRSGAIDPGILIHLLRHCGHSVDSLDAMLNHESGLAGLSGTSGDMRDLLVAIDRGDERARLALDVFVHKTRQGIAAMAASMDGIDAIAFTGGVGEHAQRVRGEICSSLAFLGVSLDAGRNESCSGENEISKTDSRVKVLVIPAQENWIIARECADLLTLRTAD